MFSEILSVFSLLKDFAFEVRDTSLEFMGDLAFGYDPKRHVRHTERKLDKFEQKRIRPAVKPRRQQELPLKYNERQLLTEITQRQPGESIIEHWKRRKYILQHPDKRSFLAAEMKVRELQAREEKIEVSRRSIASQYQAQRVPKVAKGRVRSRKR